jgi:transposase-like protein
MEELNLAKLPKYLSDESEAWALLERLRWTDGEPVCPHCGTKDSAHYLLKARNGTRETRMGNISYRRIWKCRNKACRRQFSVLVGTIFESSKVPVSKWLLALWLTGAGKNGVSALELQRHLGIAYQTAWFMSHRLREAMTREPVAGLLSGVVVADETYVGGSPLLMNAKRRKKVTIKGNHVDNKTPVFALVEKHSGQARTRVMANVTGANLAQEFKDHVDPSQSLLWTDKLNAYMEIGKGFVAHETVDHGRKEYVGPTGATTNLAECFFSQFKRSLDGTFHNVSREHLGRYATEFEFRWNTRKLTDAKRVQTLIDGVAGKRLTYKPLTER